MTKILYTGINNRSYSDISASLPPKYILVEERFTSSHDDSAGFVEIIDADDKVMKSWKFDFPMTKRFSNPDYYDDDCLVLYLQETYEIPVVGYTTKKWESLRMR